MKVPDPRLNFIITLLHSVGESRVGELAQTCGQAIHNIANPLGINISIKLSGLDEDAYIYGHERYRADIRNAVERYGIVSGSKKEASPSFVVITSDDGKTISMSVIKYLGNIIGYVAAVSSGQAGDSLPLSETVWLCATQLSMRIHAILSPSSPQASELLGRRLLTGLVKQGVRAIAIGARTGEEPWLSLSRKNEIIRIKTIERLPNEQVTSINDGEVLGENTLKYLWAEGDIEIGIWVSSDSSYYLAFGLEDRKLLNPGIMSKVKEQLEARTKDDAAYLIKSFEKLKTDFKRLVNSERVAAITETTVTVNHEINNPLTAILGNTQLLLMSKDKLPPDVVTKLQTIERSAVKIRETTTKLMSIIEPVTSPYASGLEMIDVEKSKKKKPQ